MCFRPPTVDNGPVKCPKCGAEVDPKADACPVSYTHLTLPTT